MRSFDPSIQTRGFGGNAMRAAGCAIDHDLTQHAVVGLLEVLPKLREFFRLADQAESIFRQGSVDAVVLVDFPGFNWHIARRAKKYGIPVYYYCPPPTVGMGRMAPPQDATDRRSRLVSAADGASVLSTARHSDHLCGASVFRRGRECALG